ncbi:MAG: ribosome silencing factor [Gemmatimonadales bacterium]
MTRQATRGARKPDLPGIVRAAVGAAEDRKAQDLVVLDLRGLVDATDWFLIATGTSDAHVRGLADWIQDRMGRAGYHPHHVEGLGAGRWVLLDYIDMVVHLFHPEARAFYQLERLWGDAPAIHPDPGGMEK